MRYRFGLFEFDASANELRKAGRLIKLERQPGIVLEHLLANPGAIVTRETLRQAVWGDDVHVDFDRGLAYCVSQIRIALGDQADNPKFLQTVPRQGFRFLAPIEAVSVATTSAGLPSRTSPAPRHTRLAVAGLLAAALLAAGLWTLYRTTDRPVVAVSIFDNETGQPEFDRPVAALTDVVVARLAAHPPDRLAVIGNAAALRRPRNIRNLQTVADQVRADYVLLGQLQRDASGYRFITHVVRLEDEAHLKANRLTFPDGDLSTLESAVVAEFERAVAEHILR
jgi:DNA-binding winged helix-turn-helix (wHTH) protein/TolB-like protein